MEALLKSIPTTLLCTTRPTALPTLLLRHPTHGVGLRVLETISGRAVTISRVVMQRGGIRAQVYSGNKLIPEREMWGGKWKIIE